jgi:hypothetical protein
MQRVGLLFLSNILLIDITTKNCYNLSLRHDYSIAERITNEKRIEVLFSEVQQF